MTGKAKPREATSPPLLRWEEAWQSQARVTLGNALYQVPDIGVILRRPTGLGLVLEEPGMDTSLVGFMQTHALKSNSTASWGKKT